VLHPLSTLGEGAGGEVEIALKTPSPDPIPRFREGARLLMAILP